MEKPEPKPEPLTEEESAKIIEKEIRGDLGKPTGELTEADLKKVNSLDIRSNQLTDVTVLKELTQLVELNLGGNPTEGWVLGQSLFTPASSS
ncbi:MAG: leucine-rich repeat domain-containing protein [Pirellulales bacterium]|nr:leucine-rich repeat domain-containing protein [Pirellulales bacterium]